MGEGRILRLAPMSLRVEPDVRYSVVTKNWLMRPNFRLHLRPVSLSDPLMMW
jgi:hypothetical protein